MPAVALTDYMRKDYAFSRTIQRPGKDPKGTVNMTLRCLPGRLHPSRRAENEARASRKALEEARKLESQVDKYFDITIESSSCMTAAQLDLLTKHHLTSAYCALLIVRLASLARVSTRIIRLTWNFCISRNGDEHKLEEDMQSYDRVMHAVHARTEKGKISLQCSLRWRTKSYAWMDWC